MVRNCTIATFILGAVLILGSGTVSPANASGLMEACSKDISSLCGGIKEGRGRISACLFAHSNKISAACKPELDKVTTSRMFERMIPNGIRTLNDTPYEAELRKACGSDFNKLCSGVAAGDDRLLACLYAWSTKVSKGCRTEAKTVLDQLR